MTKTKKPLLREGIKGVRLLFLLLVLLLMGCKEDIDTSARYVFRDHTVVSYLEAHSESYSQYVEMLKHVPVSWRSSSTLYQLMSARGNYTCFAPTNETVADYLQTLVDEGLIDSPTWDAFKAFPDSTKLDSIRAVIVKNSIIDGGDLVTQRFNTYRFPTQMNAEIPLANINERKLTVSWDKRENDIFYINRNCKIDDKNRDIETINGVIHQIHRVIAPKETTADIYFQDILDRQTEGYLVFARCLQACGLLDTLSRQLDEVYEEMYKTEQITDMPDLTSLGFAVSGTGGDDNGYAPMHRRYGFTIFAEPDSYWRQQGFDPRGSDLLPRLTQWIVQHGLVLSDGGFLTDENYASPQHVLRQWITYHILPMRLQADKLVYHYNEFGYDRSNPYVYRTPVMEYYQPLEGRRLLKIYESGASDGVCLNRFPIIDTRRTGSGMETGCEADKVGCRVLREDSLAVINDIFNANIFPIDAPLGYSDAVRDNLSRQRIRFDCMSMFPEAMTNEIRKKDSNEGPYQHVYIPPTSRYPYFSNMTINDGAVAVYYNGYGCSWSDMNSDVIKAVGRYDITFTLPPVPRQGTYELRYKIKSRVSRGIVQFYFGNNRENLPVTGIPVDLREDLNAWESAYEPDDPRDQDYNAEVDKRMRNKGVMKGCRSNQGENGSFDERHAVICQRRIVTRQTMDPNETYYIRIKSILDQTTCEFYIDYLELCPKEVYDNPETPEDVW